MRTATPGAIARAVVAAVLLLAPATGTVRAEEDGAAGSVESGMERAGDSTKSGVERAGKAVGDALDTAITKTGEGVSHVLEKTGEGFQKAGSAISGKDEERAEPAPPPAEPLHEGTIHEETLDE